MPLSSAERFRRYMAKLKREENQSLLKKFQEKDAARHRKTRQVKRRLKLASQKLGSQLNQLSMSSPSTAPKSTYKSVQSLAKAVHRTERALPASPRRKEEIIRQLAVKHGIIAKSLAPPKPSKTPGHSLPESTINNVVKFYQLNEISSTAPGKKDVVIIRSTDGTKAKIQKRYLVMTVREVYEQFKLMYPNEKIGSTSFSLLRPKHVLPMADIPQNVCLCKYHTNIDLLLTALSRILNTPNLTSHFREAVVCDSNDEKCMSSKCNQCGNLEKFNDLYQCDDEQGGESLSYFQWETIESKIVKVEKSGTVKDAIKDLKNQTKNFLMHSFITHVQYVHFQECQENASPMSITLQVDFSENYRTTYQDEIQNAFFNYNQVGLFTAVAWFGLDSDVVSYALVSDDVSHDKYSIHVYGAAAQFKQRFSFANLTFLSNDHNVNLIWNFFSTGHGRGAVDGVGGTVKRLVWRGVMAKQCVIRNAYDFVQYATAVITDINIILIDAQHIKAQSLLLNQRWDGIRAIPDTLKIHYVKSLSPYNVEVRLFSKSNEKKTFCLKP
ncbi:unnamed protein product [Rotaria magnacalcarata]|uniref:Uncharacterized protein n=1 Tax=Rotaria magnacalcarata TaxID=392030 RepID=A0A816MUD7_9BILA|nr:unnamed protein product [Rotaria magnacalcarata]